MWHSLSFIFQCIRIHMLPKCLQMCLFLCLHHMWITKCMYFTQIWCLVEMKIYMLAIESLLNRSLMMYNEYIYFRIIAEWYWCGTYVLLKLLSISRTNTQMTRRIQWEFPPHLSTLTSHGSLTSRLVSLSLSSLITYLGSDAVASTHVELLHRFPCWSLNQVVTMPLSSSALQRGKETKVAYVSALLCIIISIYFSHTASIVSFLFNAVSVLL